MGNAGWCGGVDVDHGEAALGGLILDEPPKLSKGPRVLEKVLLFGDTDSLSDVVQVFHHDHIAGLARIGDCFSDPVVEVGHQAALLPRQPLQEALDPLRALGLESLPLPCIPSPDMRGLPSAELETG